jgi:hypothetical protein
MGSVRWRFVLAAAVAVLGGLTVVAPATAGPPETPEAACPASSTYGIEGTVADVRAQRTPPQAAHAIETHVRITVDRSFFGHGPQGQIVLWVPGGVISEDEFLLSPHVATFSQGEAVRVCLSRSAASGEWYVVEKQAASGGGETLTPPGGGASSGGAMAAAVTGSGFVTLNFRFKYRELGTPFYINANTGDVTDEASRVIAAAKTWENDTSSWMNYTYMGSTTIARASTTDGKNVVYWTNPSDGAGCTNFVARVWVGLAWDMEFNNTCTFVNDTTPTLGVNYDTQAVATHEFGHVLGLNHTTSSGNTMCVNSNGSCSSPPYGQRGLGSGDLNGERYQYPLDHFAASTSTTSSSRTLVRGVASTGTFSFTNTGRTPWGSPFREVRLRYTDSSCSKFRDPSWISCVDTQRTTGVIERDSGGSNTFSVKFLAPLTMLPGTYVEHYRLVNIGGSLFGPTITVTFTVV